MKTIFRIAQTELRLFFYSPIAWLILIIFAFQAGMAFCDTFSYQLQNKALGRGQIPFQTVILLLGDSGSFFKVLNNLYLYIPLLTMALMSREYSSGSIKLLYSSPVTNFQIIGGKFLAMMLYGGLMLVILLLQVVFAFIFVKNLDIPLILSGLLGIYLVLCAYSAIGLFMSTLTSYQIVAAVGTLVILTCLNFVGGLWQDIPVVQEITYLLNEAAILAARANRRFITNKDLYEGVNKVLLGPQKKSRLVTETDKRITAYHESGHAILARLLPHCDPVHEVSIIPRGQAAGYTMTRPDNDDNHLTKAKLLDDIVMTLGGRVAEELIIKDISAGASGDIQAVSKRARLMVTEWGMSEKVGPISYASDKEVFIGRDMASHVTYSEETAAIIDEEVRDIVESSLAKARELLKTHKKLLDNMARLLIEHETIFTEEVDMVMAGKDPEEIMKFMDENEQKLSENPFERKSNPVIVKEKSETPAPEKTEGKPKTSAPEKTEEKSDKGDSGEEKGKDE